MKIINKQPKCLPGDIVMISLYARGQFDKIETVWQGTNVIADCHSSHEEKDGKFIINWSYFLKNKIPSDIVMFYSEVQEENIIHPYSGNDYICEDEYLGIERLGNIYGITPELTNNND